MFEVIGNELWIGELSVTFSQIGTFAVCTAAVAAYFVAANLITRKLYK